MNLFAKTRESLAHAGRKTALAGMGATAMLRETYLATLDPLVAKGRQASLDLPAGKRTTEKLLNPLKHLVLNSMERALCTLGIPGRGDFARLSEAMERLNHKVSELKPVKNHP